MTILANEQITAKESYYQQLQDEWVTSSIPTCLEELSEEQLAVVANQDQLMGIMRCT